MNWEAIGAIGEIIGALAVVVSLVYLSVQIRQNTKQVTEQIKALKLEGHNAAAADHARFREHVIRDREVASLWRRCRESYVGLPAEEQTQADHLFADYIWATINVYLRNTQTGSLDDRLWAIAKQSTAADLASFPGMQEWWGLNKASLPDDFVEIIERERGIGT